MTPQLELEDETAHGEIAGVKFYRTGHLGDEQFMERKWLVEGLLLENGCGMISADAKTGKSTLSRELGVTVATGRPFLGKYPVKKGRVLLWFREDPKEETEIGMREVCAYHGAVQKEQNIFMMDPGEQLCLETEVDQKRFTEILEALRPALVVLDSFTSFYGGSENAEQELKKATRFLLKTARTMHLVILVTHHLKKNRSSGMSSAGQKMRGNGELHAWGDHYWLLEKNKRALVIFSTDSRIGNVPSHPVNLDARGNGQSVIASSLLVEPPSINTKEEFQNKLLEFFQGKYPLSATVREVRAVLGGDATKYKPSIGALVFSGELVKLKKGYKAKNGLVCPNT